MGRCIRKGLEIYIPSINSLNYERQNNCCFISIYYYNKRTNAHSGTITETNSFNNGIGVGIEFVALDRVGFSIMVGYGAYDSFTEIKLSGETGLIFKF